MLNIRPLFLLILFAACIPPPDFQEDLPCATTERGGVLILNEGVWTQNNARLDYWTADQLCEGVFEKQNNRPLGDVANFGMLDADTLFMVMNGSRLLYKIQLPEMKLLESLSFPEASSPREIVRVGAHQAFVTSFHTEKLYEIDPVSMELRSHITVENSMEGIVFYQNTLFIACGSHPFDGENNKLAVVDPITRDVNYISLPFANPGDLEIYQNRILVSCKGNFDPSGPGSGIVVLDAETKEIIDTYPFAGSLFDMALAVDQLLVIRDSAIARIDLPTGVVDADYLPKQRLTSDPLDLIYALAFDELKGELYVGISPFGAVNGEVVRLDPFLREQERKKAGLYPGQIIFYR